MNIKILVAHHKPGLIISNDMYLPIHVGKSLSKLDLDIQGDNVGDNISMLNPIYCEMTAAYWGWKNLHADYVGLCHYRRYFTFEPMPMKSLIREKYLFYKTKICKLFHPGFHYSFQNQIIVWDDNEFGKMAFSFSEKLKRRLENGSFDIVVPRPYIENSQNIEQHYRDLGKEHMSTLKTVVTEYYPDFYPYLIRALASYKLFSANMFIMKWQLYEDYCRLVFDVLELQMKRMVSSSWCLDPLKEGCYSRISGYLAEILTSAYIMKVEAEGGNILHSNSIFLAA